jgi:regulator of nucleoside diphosphate kinase
MENQHELLVSASDAEVLALELGKRRHANPADADAADALADLLMEARLVPHEWLPADRVAMSSRVRYEEKPGGVRRTVTLVHPLEANPAQDRISVLSPIGRALLGRCPGAVIDVCPPSGQALVIRVLSTEKQLLGR